MTTITRRAAFTSVFAFFLATAIGFGAHAAHAAVTSQMDLGSTGANVSQLQTYLATNASIYPSGLVTGYFGPLTQAGVERFQVAQGIVSSGTPGTTGYGRVGPTTLIRLNNLMGSGQVSSNAVPVLSNTFVQYTKTTATFTWATNEPTQGQVYWSTTPIVENEATGPGQTPYISGTPAIDASGFQTSHSVTVSNLQADTTYYYVVRVNDNVGGVSVTWPVMSFHTTQ